MKRIIVLFVVVLIIYFFLKFIIHDFVLGHDIDYQIKNGKNTFEIREVLNLKKDQNVTNYYFEVTKDKTTFVFKTDYNFKKDMKIIEQIEYFKDDTYECLLPVFKDETIPLDMMCYYEDQLYFNHNLPQTSAQLNEFIETINDIYDFSKWSDSKTQSEKIDSITLYKANIIDKHYVVLDNYRGIYIISQDNITNVKLFDQDVYETHIKGLVNDKFVIANYNDEYDFNQFYTVDITNEKKDEIIVNYDISFDGYTNGSYKDSLFLVDRETKRQYEFNIKKEEAYIVGDQKNGILFYDNEEETTIDMNEALKKEYKFNKNYETDKNYDRIDTVNGYYYLYKLVDDDYQVYKAPIEDKKETIYLFNTDNIDDIYYIDSYIYFRKGNDVLYYKDDIGIKTLFTNSEYEFNENLKYYLYTEV